MNLEPRTRNTEKIVQVADMNIKLIFWITVFVTFTCISVSGQRTITLEELRKKKQVSIPDAVSTPMPSAKPEMNKSKTNIIADGSYSRVESPFVFVARDIETYKIINSMIQGYDISPGIDFDKYAVVAAFSGAKETGGYAVSIEMKNGKCEIEDVAPPHGAIVTEAISHPYAVAIVPVEEQDPLEIVAGETWGKAMNLYEVTSGSFEFSGGFIGMTKKFDVGGTVGVLKNGNHISFFFRIQEKVEDPVRRMYETGSGTLDKKMPEISRLEAGDLIDRPHPPLRVEAKFDGDWLELDFMPGKRGYIVNDGFEGRGNLKAKKKLVD